MASFDRPSFIPGRRRMCGSNATGLCGLRLKRARGHLCRASPLRPTLKVGLIARARRRRARRRSLLGRGPGRGRAGVLVRGCRAMELTAVIRVLLQVQHGIICLHRSHFGSRYKTGCCGHAGLLIFWPRFDPRRGRKLDNRTNHMDHSATFHMSLCVTTCSGWRPETIADVRTATSCRPSREVATGCGMSRRATSCVGRRRSVPWHFRPAASPGHNDSSPRAALHVPGAMRTVLSRRLGGPLRLPTGAKPRWLLRPRGDA